MTALADTPTPTERDIVAFRRLHQRLGDAVETAVHGKRAGRGPGAGRHLRRRPRAARGRARHREDHPGPGGRAGARRLRRVQFTPDLLPSDVTGTTVFDPRDGQVRFRPGPVFANVVLADEINRAAAKTQSALLEVMEERTVTVDGVAPPRARPVPGDRHAEPDRPRRHLPAARGAARPVPGADLARLPGRRARARGAAAGQHRRPGRRGAARDHARRDRRASGGCATLHVADPILRYIREVGVAIRNDPRVRLGASTRGLRALVRCVQVYAAAQGRHYVVPSDVQRLAEPVLAHRTVLTRDAVLAGHTPELGRRTRCSRPCPRRSPTRAEHAAAPWQALTTRGVAASAPRRRAAGAAWPGLPLVAGSASRCSSCSVAELVAVLATPDLAVHREV